MWKGTEAGRHLKGSGKEKEASMAGKEMREEKQGEIRLWRFEQISQDLEARSRILF